MVRVSFAVVVVAVLAVVAGCTMCCHPYDYCGPVFEGHGRHATGCQQGVRAGSAFSGVDGVVETENSDATTTKSMTRKSTTSKSMVTKAAPSRKVRQPSPQNVPSEDVAGAEQIISVTDRVVDSPALADQMASEPEATVLVEKPQSAQRWTAKRSTDATILR